MNKTKTDNGYQLTSAEARYATMASATSSSATPKNGRTVSNLQRLYCTADKLVFDLKQYETPADSGVTLFIALGRVGIDAFGVQ